MALSFDDYFFNHLNLLGVLSIQLGMSEPLLVIGHQLVACLLVAVLAALNF